MNRRGIQQVAVMEKGSRRGKRPCAATPPIPSPTVKAGDEEKFYALLGSISAMRDLIRANKSKRQKTVASLPLWRPTFELEDFKEEDKEPGTVAGRGRTDGEEEKNEVGEGEKSVDLCLSL